MSLKYNGKGFLKLIPARDLTDEEVEKYGGEAFLVGSGLYYQEVTLDKETPWVHITLHPKPSAEQQAPAAPIEEKPKRRKKAKQDS